MTRLQPKGQLAKNRDYAQNSSMSEMAFVTVEVAKAGTDTAFYSLVRNSVTSGLFQSTGPTNFRRSTPVRSRERVC